MGVCGAKSQQNQPRPSAPLTQRQITINHVFLKYIPATPTIHKDRSSFKCQSQIQYFFQSQGIKKTNQYESRLSKGEWVHKRAEFWETRIEGRPQHWLTIKLACEAEEQDGLAILSAGELKLVSKSIQIIYDSQGFKYDIPIFCINEPIQFPEKPSTELGLTQVFDQEEIKITIRGVKLQRDLVFPVSKTILIQEIKTLVLDKEKEQGLSNVRLFYSGREMQDHHQLGNYNIPAKTVLQALCT